MGSLFFQIPVIVIDRKKIMEEIKTKVRDIIYEVYVLK